jgi:hypothetical protein
MMLAEALKIKKFTAIALPLNLRVNKISCNSIFVYFIPMLIW